MSTNYIQPGDTIEVTAGGTITAGQGVLYGARGFGVALHGATSGQSVQLRTTGVFTMAKTSALAITRGDALYWDDTNKVVNKTTSGQVMVGIAESAAVNPSSTVAMRLVPTQPGT